MHKNGIKAKHKHRFKVTTDSKHNLSVAPNLLERNFTPEVPIKPSNSFACVCQTLPDIAKYK